MTIFDGEPDNSGIETVQRIKIILIARATGRTEAQHEEEYQQLRASLLLHPLSHLLPSLVRSCRTLEEFWMYIRPEFASYDDRRRFLREQFEPLLSRLEESPILKPSAMSSAAETTSPNPTAAPDLDGRMRTSTSSGIGDTRKVFVVHGRNIAARRELFTFLRALHLQPLEWEHAVRLTGTASPYVGDVLDAGFATARAVIVLFTPDDEARLRTPYLDSSDPDFERHLTPQPRQNVLFEAGMAMGKCPDRTIIVTLGQLRPMSDVAGRHVIRLENTPECRNTLAHRLREAGCEIDNTGSDWLNAGNFSELLDTSQAMGISSVAASLSNVELRPALATDEAEYILEMSRPRNQTAYNIDQ